MTAMLVRSNVIMQARHRDPEWPEEDEDENDPGYPTTDPDSE